MLLLLNSMVNEVALVKFARKSMSGHDTFPVELGLYSLVWNLINFNTSGIVCADYVTRQ